MCHLCESQNIKITLYMKTADSAAPKAEALHCNVQRLTPGRCTVQSSAYPLGHTHLAFFWAENILEASVALWTGMSRSAAPKE